VTVEGDEVGVVDGGVAEGRHKGEFRG